MKLFVSRCRKTSLGNPSVFQKKLLRTFSCIGGRRHHVFVEFFCFRGQKIFVGSPICFSKFLMWIKFMCNGWVRDIPFFPRKIRVSKHFMHQVNVGKTLWIRNGGIISFRLKFLHSLCRKFSCENPSMFQKTRGFEKIYA